MPDLELYSLQMRKACSADALEPSASSISYRRASTRIWCAGESNVQWDSITHQT